MLTTTLKLPDELKSRIAPLAEAAGMSPHAWMVNALSAQTELAERRADFVQTALDAAAEVDADGKVYRADDVHAFLRNKIAGQPARRPRSVRLARD